MARFMIAHLQDGRYGEARVLRSEMAQQMHSRLFANDPRLSGMACGFMEFRMNGQIVLELGGSAIYSHGMPALLPEQSLGVYVAYNFLDSAPHWALEKVAWYEAPPFSQALAVASLALFLTVLVVGGLSAVPTGAWPRGFAVAILALFLFCLAVRP